MIWLLSRSEEVTGNDELALSSIVWNGFIVDDAIWPFVLKNWNSQFIQSASKCQKVAASLEHCQTTDSENLLPTGISCDWIPGWPAVCCPHCSTRKQEVFWEHLHSAATRHVTSAPRSVAIHLCRTAVLFSSPLNLHKDFLSLCQFLHVPPSNAVQFERQTQRTNGNVFSFELDLIVFDFTLSRLQRRYFKLCRQASNRR